ACVTASEPRAVVGLAASGRGNLPGGAVRDAPAADAGNVASASALANGSGRAGEADSRLVRHAAHDRFSAAEGGLAAGLDRMAAGATAIGADSRTGACSQARSLVPVGCVAESRRVLVSS